MRINGPFILGQEKPNKICLINSGGIDCIESMKVHCSHDSLVSISELAAHPKNRNKHPQAQIERLAEILKYQGWRYPVKVSKQSGFVTSGHGRIEAAKLNGWKEVPVNFQDYDDDTQEYADVQSDNSIASWAELDLSSINADLVDLGPDFDINLLGIKDFVIEPMDREEVVEKEILFQYKIEIDCFNEKSQQEIAEELENRGFKVRVLI